MIPFSHATLQKHRVGQWLEKYELWVYKQVLLDGVIQNSKALWVLVLKKGQSLTMSRWDCCFAM